MTRSRVRSLGTVASMASLATAFVLGGLGAGSALASGGGGAGADLQMSGVTSTSAPKLNAPFSATFHVKNAGPAAATTATFANALAAGIGFAGATVNGAAAACSQASGVVSCALGTVAKGALATVVVSLTAPSTAGTYASVATVASAATDPVTTNNSVTLTVQVKADTIKVTKCYYDLGTGQMLIKAASSDPTARLFAYRPDGTYQGEVQNGGGNRYGGTFMGWIYYDPLTMTIKSTSGGSITAPTTPFGV
jgi:hypothetical protein